MKEFTAPWEQLISFYFFPYSGDFFAAGRQIILTVFSPTSVSLPLNNCSTFEIYYVGLDQVGYPGPSCSKRC